jgi:hypothetical protein
VDYNYFIAELVAMKANCERLIRELQQSQSEQIASAHPTAQGQHAPAPPPSQIRDPLAKSMSDLVTPKQLGMIRALASKVALDPDEECQSVFRCKTDELSKRAASSFIDHLQQCKHEFKQPKVAS